MIEIEVPIQPVITQEEAAEAIALLRQIADTYSRVFQDPDRAKTSLVRLGYEAFWLLDRIDYGCPKRTR